MMGIASLDPSHPAVLVLGRTGHAGGEVSCSSQDGWVGRMG